MSIVTLPALFARLWLQQRLPPGALAPGRDRRLRQLLWHAFETVPFYRRRWREAGISPAELRSLADLARLPVVTKAELRDAGEDALSEAVRGRRELGRLRTSGSTGRPFTLYELPEFRALRRAAFLRALCAGPYRPGRRLLLITNAGERPPARWLGWRYVSSEAPAAEIADALEAFRPDFVYGLLSPLRRLLGHYRRTGLRPPAPRAVYTSAESLDPLARRGITELFAAPVLDIYGMTETGPLAWQCMPGGPYHLADDTTIVELLPSPLPGRVRLVVTPLWQTAMPLVRYDTGDLAVAAAPASCACGCRFGAVAQIEGRIVDCIRLVNGETLSPYSITLALEQVGGIARYRVVQETLTRFRVEIEPEQSAGAALEAEVRRALLEVLGPRVELAVAFHRDLEPPSGRKFKVVECRLGEEQPCGC